MAGICVGWGVGLPALATQAAAQGCSGKALCLVLPRDLTHTSSGRFLRSGRLRVLGEADEGNRHADRLTYNMRRCSRRGWLSEPG